MPVLADIQAVPINEAIILVVVGMGCVFGSLIVLMGLIHWLTKLLDVQIKSNRSATVPVDAGARLKSDEDGASEKDASAKKASASDDEVDPALIAVLTAAATAALGGQVRITSVNRYVQSTDSWSRQGVGSLLSGHIPVRYGKS